MAYNKTEWVNGDIITAEKLNKIEQGIADSSNLLSPTISVENIVGGHTVIITDTNGSQSFDVMNGTNGANGQDGHDYTMTQEDYDAIAETVVANLPVYNGELTIEGV